MRVLRDRKRNTVAGGGQNPFLFAYFSLFIVKGVKRWHYYTLDTKVYHQFRYILAFPLFSSPLSEKYMEEQLSQNFSQKKYEGTFVTYGIRKSGKVNLTFFA